MHKAGADGDMGGGETAGNTEHQPLFEMPSMPKGQHIQLGLSLPLWETINGSFFKACLAEFFFTSMLLFLGTGTVVFGCNTSDSSTTPTNAATGQVSEPEDCFLNNSRVVTIAMAFGFAILVLVYSAASFSGGHLNPAVTLGFLITKKITLMRATAYVIFQLLGAILGSAFIYAINRAGWHASKGGTNRLLPGISLAAGWLLEALLTMLLVFTVFAATDSNRARISTHLPILAPAAIGFAVFVAHLVAVPLDGCSINPARSFAPAVVSGVWTDQWIFWVGPFTGAIVASVLYETFFRPSGQMVEGHPADDSSSDEDDDDVAEKGQRLKKRRSRNSFRMPAYSGISGVKVVNNRRMKAVLVPEEADVPEVIEEPSDIPALANHANGHMPGHSDSRKQREKKEKVQHGAVDAQSGMGSDAVPGTTGSHV